MNLDMKQRGSIHRMRLELSSKLETNCYDGSVDALITTCNSDYFVIRNNLRFKS